MDSKKKQSFIQLKTPKKEIIVEKALMLNMREGKGKGNSIATFKNQIIKIKICSSDFTGDKDFPSAVQELLSQMKNTKSPGEKFILTFMYKENKSLEELTLKEAVVLYIEIKNNGFEDILIVWIGFKDVQMTRSLDFGKISVNATMD
jgi:hypothetical protein